MLVHLPAFSLTEKDNSQIDYYASLVFVCLRSYYETGNDAPVLVSTNNPVLHELIGVFKKKSGYPFQQSLLSRDELKTIFGLSDEELGDVPLRRYFLSKLHPILRKADEQLLHVDYDTIFTGKIPLPELFREDICLFADPAGRHWVNSGVFAVQGRGFEVVRTELIDVYLNRNGREGAVSRMLERYSIDASRFAEGADEVLLYLLLREQRGGLHLSPAYQYNFLAYDLGKHRGWERTPSIIHFHWYKPMNCAVRPGSAVFLSGDAMAWDTGVYRERFNRSLYKAVLWWYRHLHHVNALMDGRLQTLCARAPLELVEEHLAHLSKVQLRYTEEMVAREETIYSRAAGRLAEKIRGSREHGLLGRIRRWVGRPPP